MVILIVCDLLPNILDESSMSNYKLNKCFFRIKYWRILIKPLEYRISKGWNIFLSPPPILNGLYELFFLLWFFWQDYVFTYNLYIYYDMFNMEKKEFFIGQANMIAGYIWFFFLGLIAAGIVGKKYGDFIGILPLVWILCRYYFFCKKTKIELTDHWVSMKIWVFFTKEKEVLYSKINDIEVKKWFWSNVITILAWNDTPLVFKNVEQIDLLKRIILEKIDVK